MIADTEPTQPVDATIDGTEATQVNEDPSIGRYNVMSDIGDLYTDIHEFAVGKVTKKIPPTNIFGPASPPPTMDFDHEQSLEVFDTSSIHVEPDIDVPLT